MPGEGPAERLDHPPVHLVETQLVDAEDGESGRGHILVDAPAGAHLGVVAGAPEQPVGDPGGAAGAPGQQDRPRRGDLDPQQPRRADDDRGQLLGSVVVEPEGHPEAVAQRAAQGPGPRRRPDHGERLEAQSERLGPRPLARHEIEGEILHGRVERLLHGTVEAVDLVDEEDIAGLEGGEDRGQHPLVLQGRPAGEAGLNAHLGGDDLSQGGLAEARGTVEEDVIDRFGAGAGRLDEDAHLLADGRLADEVLEPAGTEDGVGRPLLVELSGADHAAVVHGMVRRGSTGRRRSRRAPAVTSRRPRRGAAGPGRPGR